MICSGDFEARVAAVEAGDVAELALIRAAAGILDAAEEIPFHIGELIGRDRKLRHRHAVLGRQHDLLLGARRIARQDLEQLIGGVAELADMEIVERRIIIRARADRGTAERDRQVELMGAAADVVHVLALDVHAADEDGLRPFELFPRRAAEILVDELDLPFLGQIGREQQQALRRHEGADAVGQRVGMLERAERRRVTREDAENMPARSVAFSAHRTSPNHVLGTVLTRSPDT